MTEVYNFNLHLPAEWISGLSLTSDLFFPFLHPSSCQPLDGKTGFLQLGCSMDADFHNHTPFLTSQGGASGKTTTSPLKRNHANPTSQQPPRKKPPTPSPSLNVKKEPSLLPSAALS